MFFILLGLFLTRVKNCGSTEVKRCENGLHCDRETAIMTEIKTHDRSINPKQNKTLIILGERKRPPIARGKLQDRLATRQSQHSRSEKERKRNWFGKMIWRVIRVLSFTEGVKERERGGWKLNRLEGTVVLCCVVSLCQWDEKKRPVFCQRGKLW